MAIQAKYDAYVSHKSANIGVGEERFNKRFPKSTDTLLNKTLKFLDKPSHASKRLGWAALKQEKFEGLIAKLIGYNDSIENLLERSVIDQLQFMQQQTYMAILQLNSNVAELKEISSAMSIQSQVASQSSPSSVPSQSSFARLADFKAQQMALDSKTSEAQIDPIRTSEVIIHSSDGARSEATYRSTRVWIEWKQFILDPNRDSAWNRTIEDRIKKLAILLGSEHKSEQFRSPKCIGYFNDRGKDRYGFLYLKPDHVPSLTVPTSLYDLITTLEKPSLSARIILAHAISRCLMFLHSVNWLHKGVRSRNVVFFIPSGQKPEYSKPTIAGFEYARPDLPEEETEPPVQHSEHDVYRHPALLVSNGLRSQKSHDIYSLGVVLVEIAHWQPIGSLMSIPQDSKKARSMVKKVRSSLLDNAFLSALDANVGEAFTTAIRKCLIGGKEIGIQEGADETDVEMGASMQSVFAEEVVNRLQGIRV